MPNENVHASLWLADGPAAPSHPPLRADLTVDVAVIKQSAEKPLD